MGGAHFDPRRHHPVPTAWEAAGTGGGPSVGRIPDDGEGVLIILPGGPAQIGIEPAGSEFRRSEAQRHIVLAGGFADPDPARPDLHPRRHDAIVGLVAAILAAVGDARSEEHTSELQSLMRISFAVFCWKQKRKHIIA